MKEEKPARGTPMKLTRSLPAKARARAKVPISTTTLKTLTFSQWRTCISRVKNTKNTVMSGRVLSCIQCLFSGVMKELSFSPLMSMK